MLNSTPCCETAGFRSGVASSPLFCDVTRYTLAVVYPRFATAYYRGADKTLARPTSRCILFDGEYISFDASLVLYIYI